MTVVETSAHARIWADIASRATTPQLMACVLVAHQSVRAPDPAALAKAYQAAQESGRYAGLDRLSLCAGEIAELAIVVDGGAAGVSAARLDGAARIALARHHLTAVRPGSRWGSDDRRATVVATLAGVAVVRAAQGRPVELNETEALPLAVIQSAMRNSPDRGCALWPGTQQALRMALMWRLVEYVRLPAPPSAHWSGKIGKFVYRLTAEGEAALESHRRARSGHAIKFTKSTADLLTRLSRYGRGDPGVMEPAMASAVQRCLEARWISEGPVIPGTNRRALKVTEDGRDALAGWKFRHQTAAQTTPRPTTRHASELQQGQMVRMLHRQDYPGLGPDWVNVVEVVVHATSTTQRLARNCEVWVTSAAQVEPFLYTGQPLLRTVRFQLKPL